MIIFGSEQPEKTDFEKIGVKNIHIFKNNGKWVFKKNGKIWDIAPAQITDMSLSPIVMGLDRMIVTVCNLKNISNSENGIFSLFSEEWFPGCDVKLVFKENKFNGWIYDIESENFQGFISGQSVWICSYMKMYYKDVPKNLFLKIEAVK